MNDDARYAALQARDRRFDGRFFTGVISTGIYCRPICPARIPARSRVAFYGSAAAAEGAGFRACRRCRPETAPGSAAWSGTHALVVRALRLIERGALDDAPIAEFAARLGVSARHLRRLFDEHAGAPPGQFAMTRRAHFARELLTSCDAKMPVVASAAGFKSLRRFNEAMRESFDRTPTEIRAGHAGGSTTLKLRVPVVLPYDFKSLLSFFRARALPRMERVTSAEYARFIAIDGHCGWARVSFDGERLGVALDPALMPVALRVVERMRFMFDVDADVQTIGEHLRRDARFLRSVEARPGLRVPGMMSTFETAARAVVGQQVSVSGAATVLGRIVAAHGQHGDHGAAFPTPESLRDAACEGFGMPGARAQTLRDVAAAFAEGFDAERDGSGALQSIRGVGPWTVSYLAMRGVKDPDAFPGGDLILKRALEVRTGNAAETLSQPWRPFRAYAAAHLWAEHAASKEE